MGSGIYWAGGLVVLAGAALAWAVTREREKPTDLHLE
jgi:hypothetical protein